MNTYDNTFYDLLSRALGGNDSARLQGFMDESIAAKYGELQLDGFRFAEDMQLDFTFEQILKDVGLNVMANYYDLDSPAKPFATEGAEVYSDRIPRMKAVEYWNEDKYRKMLITEERFGVEAVADAAYRGLFRTVDSLVGNHVNSLTFQRHQMVSNGKVVINSTNNPYGISGVTISAHIPSANIKTLTSTQRWWTSYNATTGVYSSEGADSDPIGNLQEMVKKAKQHSIRRMHFEVEETYLDQILNHSKVIAALKDRLAIVTGISSLSGIGVFDRNVKIDALGAIVGAPFVSIDSIVATESYNTTTKKIVKTQMNAFEGNVVVLVPDGDLGEVMTVEPLRMQGGTYASYFGGRLLLTVDVDAIKKCQTYATEMTSIVVPDKSKLMFYLHPYSA